MISLKEMLKAGVHFGHKTSRWSPAMAPYIWGSRNKIHLIDVSKTAFLLERCGKFLKEKASEGGSFLWVGTKKPAQDIVKSVALKLKMPYVAYRWIGGTLSNYDQIKKAITKLLYLKDAVSKPGAHYTKKEISVMQKEYGRLEKNLGGIIDLKFPPTAIIVVDAKKEHSAVKEAIRMGVPVVALVDTNTDPDGINFVIPANDDSSRSIKFILRYLADCIADGRKVYEVNLKEEEAKSKSDTVNIEKRETRKSSFSARKKDSGLSSSHKKSFSAESKGVKKENKVPESKKEENKKGASLKRNTRVTEKSKQITTFKKKAKSETVAGKEKKSENRKPAVSGGKDKVSKKGGNP